ncbi:MAG: 4-hydroxy-tetrahydrodipicolinate reductase [Bacteroidetes bacterium]|nr:4-hydroxy-tetrahydrodipicolinate reductase [Bacteroidota bacterium]
MGHEIHRIITERDWPEPFIVDPQNARVYESIDDLVGRGVEVCIEFTAPGEAVRNILACVRAGLPVVSGTTGWDAENDFVAEAVRTSGSACIHASNFSVGIFLYKRIADFAASLLRDFPQYDFALHEVHHTGKKDSPSGTALSVARSMLAANPRKTSIATSMDEYRSDPQALYVTSARVGTVFGDHHLLIDSEADSIELTHRAKGRRGFAEGALLAAQWICDKHGMFTLEDMFDDITKA